MKMQTLALFGMVATAIGGVAYVFIYPLLSGERKVEQRRASVTRSEPAARTTGRAPQRSRREQVEETLKELDVRANKPKRLPLQTRIAQAGLSWSKNQFLMISAGLGLAGFLAVLVMVGSLLPALGVGFAAAFGCRDGCCRFSRSAARRNSSTTFPTAST